MENPIESGTTYIESPFELELNVDSLNFEDIEDISLENGSNEKVYDLEVENQHNYLVDGLGFAHNGGGKK